MKLNNKLPAFTIMEVTIAMLIAGIAIAITFTAYRIVTRVYIDFSKKQNNLATFIGLDKLLKQDFVAAKNIVRSSEGLVLQLDGGVVTYQINEQYLVRDQFSLRTDTFKINVNHLNYLFEQAPVEAHGVIDQVNFDVAVEGEQIPVQYQKIYSAQTLFR